MKAEPDTLPQQDDFDIDEEMPPSERDSSLVKLHLGEQSQEMKQAMQGSISEKQSQSGSYIAYSFHPIQIDPSSCSNLLTQTRPASRG